MHPRNPKKKKKEKKKKRRESVTTVHTYPLPCLELPFVHSEVVLRKKEKKKGRRKKNCQLHPLFALHHTPNQEKKGKEWEKGKEKRKAARSLALFLVKRKIQWLMRAHLPKRRQLKRGKQGKEKGKRKG